MHRKIVLISGFFFRRIFHMYIIIISKTLSTDHTHDGTHSIHISHSAHVLAHTTNHISTEINKNAGQQQPNQIIKEMKKGKSSLSTRSRFWWIVWLSQINVFIFCASTFWKSWAGQSPSIQTQGWACSWNWGFEPQNTRCSGTSLYEPPRGAMDKYGPFFPHFW